MSDRAPHDWYLPRLKALVAEASAAGFAPDVSVAVVTDLMNGPAFTSAAEDVADEDWNRDIGEPDALVNPSIEASLDVTGEHSIGGRVGPGHVNPGLSGGKSLHHYGSHGLRRL
jgi:hypothetical protein